MVMIMCGAPGKGNLEDRVIFWISPCKGARREAEQGQHPEGVGGLHQAAEAGQGEEERAGGEVQEAGAEPQEGASQDTGETFCCLADVLLF